MLGSFHIKDCFVVSIENCRKKPLTENLRRKNNTRLTPLRFFFSWNSLNPASPNVKFHQMSVTSHRCPYPRLSECYKIFLIFYWNYTRNYTRNYVSPAAIFKKPQVRDPETLTADKKLLGAAVLLTSHLSCTPLHWKPSPVHHLHLSHSTMGRTHQQAPTTRFSLLLSYSSNIPCCVDSLLSTLRLRAASPRA